MARALANHFDEVRLLSLRRLAMASEIQPRDPRGPFVVVQRGYDPADPARTTADFLLGRSGAWLSTHWFLRLPVEERRSEFIFGTVAEVARLLEDLPLTVTIARPEAAAAAAPAPDDEFAQLLGSAAAP